MNSAQARLQVNKPRQPLMKLAISDLEPLVQGLRPQEVGGTARYYLKTVQKNIRAGATSLNRVL
jgi:hypothetical protein